MADIDFGGQKIQSTSIKKDDFVASMKDNGIEEAKAKSIFDKFNTNNEGESLDVLDKDEQLKVMQFLKTVAKDDTTITEEEFTAQADLAKANEIESFDILSKTFDAIKSIIAKDTSDDLEVEYDGDTAKVKEEASTKNKRVKYDPVHLTDAWKNSRDIANNIDTDKYKDIKTKSNASEVLEVILTAQGIKDVSEADKTALLKRLVKFNPSMFNRETGEVWEDADWTKLDFPTGTDVSAMISEEADLSGVGEAALKPSTSDGADGAAGADGADGAEDKTTLEDPSKVDSSKIETAVKAHNEGKAEGEQLRKTSATKGFGIYCEKSNIKDKNYPQHYIYANGKMEKIEKFIPDIKSNEHVFFVGDKGDIVLIDDNGISRSITIKYDDKQKKYVNADSDSPESKSGSDGK